MVAGVTGLPGLPVQLPVEWEISPASASAILLFPRWVGKTVWEMGVKQRSVRRFHVQVCLWSWIRCNTIMFQLNSLSLFRSKWQRISVMENTVLSYEWNNTQGCFENEDNNAVRGFVNHPRYNLALSLKSLRNFLFTDMSLHIKNKHFLSKRKLSLYLLGIHIESSNSQVSLIFVNKIFTNLTQLIAIIILLFIYTFKPFLETFHSLHFHFPFI